MPMNTAASGHQRQKRRHDARQGDRQLDLARYLIESLGVDAHQRLGEDDPEQQRARP